ncbi:uncharacterized protein LOC115937095, partial [Leptonychotes weddellii]|uniref:Uncharacterized protein LOC115937095 n=1 Tax=Leptonychotes weddellii TaxID=9713 RepID=A0A7F8PZ57_LEPWE
SRKWLQVARRKLGASGACPALPNYSGSQGQVEAERVNRALDRGDCWTPIPVRHDVGGRPPICPALNPWSFLSPVLRTTRKSRRLGKPPNDDSSEGAGLAELRPRSSAGQGCLNSTARRPVWRPLVTSGGATPAMLRAAPRPKRSARPAVRGPGLWCGPVYEKGSWKQVASLVRNHSGGGRLPDGLQSLIFPPSSRKRAVMPPCVICGRGAWPGCGGGFHHRWTRLWRPSAVPSPTLCRNSVTCESFSAWFLDKWPH